ncbi:MAG: hypothetical protein IJ493_07035 [Clostridia bacterium]|nr:hypothetical protein [Clostridia bacterium]
MNDIKATLKRASELESTIYTCDRTMAEVGRQLSPVGADAWQVEQYKDGDIIPYTNGEFAPAPGPWEKFFEPGSRDNGYSAPIMPPVPKRNHLGRIILGLIIGAVPAFIITWIAFAIHSYYVYCNDEAKLRFYLKWMLIIGLPIALFVYLLSAPETKSNLEMGFNVHRKTYLAKLTERNEKLVVEHRLIAYYNQTSDIINPIRERAAAELKALYAEGTIFEKYRNFVAVTQLLEYLESGRCTELTGPDGAYNLFESESRANVIIAKLDKIVGLLKEIRDTQFMIYRSLESLNSLLGAVSCEIEQVRISVDANTAAINRWGEETCRRLGWN